MPPRDLPLALDPDQNVPLFVRIAQALSRDIARGRLRPGDGLPGTRTLAGSLRVHRSTVVAAYGELAAQGWVTARRGGATVVAVASPGEARRRPDRAARHAGVAPATGYRLDAPLVEAPPFPRLPPDGIYLSGGAPDLRLVPVDLLARAYRRVTRRSGRRLFGYSDDSLGHPRLRAAIARWVSDRRGIAAGAEAVIITRGSQMALDLAARSLIRPGDVVAVEALGYPNAVNVFRRAGASVVPIAVDEQGIDVDALAALSRRTSVRLVYLTPHHQFPTTVTLSPTRRLALLDLARRARIAILEDDYDQEYHYDGRPVLPLASDDPAGSVIYVGTLAKILAPGLRIAFVVAPPPVITRMAAERALVDHQGDAALECAIAELIEDGEIERHAWRTRRIYHARRDAFCAAAARLLGDAVTFRPPPGGMAVWLKVAPDIDVDAWQRRCLDRGAYFVIGRQYTVDGSDVPAVRLGFAQLDERESAAALRRIAAGLPARRRSTRRSPR